MIRETARPIFTARCSKTLLTLALIVAFAATQIAVPAGAGTTSTISGTVTDAATGKPLSGVLVTAASPSARLSATSDARGFYSMTGVPSDTYTVTFALVNFEPVTVTGVTAFADQIARVNETLQKSPKTIAQVRSRSVGGAFQPTVPADTVTVTAAQINNIQGTPLNINQGNLLRALPGVSFSLGDEPSIRGGRTDMVDYEFEGMPYTDPYLNKYINNLTLPGFGLQSLQLTPGNEDASFGNSGDGTVNMIARQGTYPAEFDFGAAAGGPGFFHGLNLGYGFATPNGRWSDYASFTAQNTAPQYGGPYADQAASAIGVAGAVQLTEDREFTNNLVYSWGKNNRYSAQYFVDTSYHRASGGYGQDWQSECFATSLDSTCNSAVGYFTGATGLSPAQYQELLTLQPGQPSAGISLGAIGRPPYQEFYNGSGSKLQFNWHADSSTYLYVDYYNTLGQDISDQVCCGPAASIYRNQGGWTNGGNLGITKQLSDKNLLKLGGDLIRLNPHNEGFFNTDQFFNLGPFGDTAQELYDFLPPTDPNCPLGAGGCGHLYQYFNNPSLIQVPPGGSAAVLTQKGGAAYATDSWQPNSKLHVDGGLRLDVMKYDLPPQGVLADCTTRYEPLAWQTPDPNGLINGKPVGPGNCPQAIFAPITSQESNPQILQPRIALAYQLDTNDAVRASFGRTVRFIHGQEMDYTAPPTYGSQFAGIPAWYNPFVVNAPTSKGGCAGVPNCNSGPYAGALYANAPVECGYSGFQVPCQTYQEQLYWAEINDDFAFPISPLKPVTASNYDASYMHQFKGGWAVRITPWSRRTYDLDVLQPVANENLQGQLVINALGQPTYRSIQVASNNGLEKASGVELYLTKDAPIGLSGSITLDTTDVEQNVYPTSADEYHGFIAPAVAAFPNLLYRVNYVSPFTGSLALSYKMKDGWRFQTTAFYDDGYPYGDGLFAPESVAGVPAIVPRTNANGGSTQFLDPSNPGSFYSPHVAATLGTPEGTYADSQLTHANLSEEITIEKTMGKSTLGFQINNLYNNPYPGPTFDQGTFSNVGPYGLTSGNPLYTFTGFSLNGYYQPVATGVAGPLTGANKFCNSTTQLCNAIGNGPYVHYPNGQGLNFFVYLTTHV